MQLWPSTPSSQIHFALPLRLAISAGAQSSRDRMHWRHCFFPLWPCRVNKQSWPIRDGGIWIGTCKKGWVINFQYTHSKFPPKCYFISRFNSPTGSDQPGKGSFTSSKMSWLQTKCLFNNLFTFFLSYLHLKSNLYGQSFAFSTHKSRALEWRGPAPNKTKPSALI